MLKGITEHPPWSSAILGKTHSPRWKIEITTIPDDWMLATKWYSRLVLMNGASKLVTHVPNMMTLV